MLRFTCLRSSRLKATFWRLILPRTVGTVERMHVPFSVWVLPITGLGPGWWCCISHGPKPFFRSSPPSSKTSKSKAYWGWLWESGAGLGDIWSRGRARVLLLCRRPQAEAPYFPHLRATMIVWLPPPSVPGGPTVHRRKKHSKFMSPPKWDSWRLSYFSTYNNP